MPIGFASGPEPLLNAIDQYVCILTIRCFKISIISLDCNFQSTDFFTCICWVPGRVALHCEWLVPWRGLEALLPRGLLLFIHPLTGWEDSNDPLGSLAMIHVLCCKGFGLSPCGDLLVGTYGLARDMGLVDPAEPLLANHGGMEGQWWAAVRENTKELACYCKAPLQWAAATATSESSSWYRTCEGGGKIEAKVKDTGKQYGDISRWNIKLPVCAVSAYMFCDY